MRSCGLWMKAGRALTFEVPIAHSEDTTPGMAARDGNSPSAAAVPQPEVRSTPPRGPALTSSLIWCCNQLDDMHCWITSKTASARPKRSGAGGARPDFDPAGLSRNSLTVTGRLGFGLLFPLHEGWQRSGARCRDSSHFALKSLNSIFLKITSIGPPWCNCQAMMPSSGILAKSPSTVVFPFSLMVTCLPTHLME